MSCRKRVLETGHETKTVTLTNNNSVDVSDGPSSVKHRRVSASSSESDKREAHVADTPPAELNVKTGTPCSKTDRNTGLQYDRAHRLETGTRPFQEDCEYDACELIELYAPFEQLSIEDHGE